MRNLLNSIIAAAALAVLDTLCVIFAFWFAVSIRTWIGNYFVIPELSTNDFMLYVVNNWWIVPLYLTVFLLNGLYSKHRPFWQEARTLINAIALAALFAYSIISLGKIDTYVSRILFVLHPLLLLIIVPLVRRAGKSLLYKLGYWKREVIELLVDTDYTLDQSFARNTFIGYVVASSVKVSLKKDSVQEIIDQVRTIRKRVNTSTILVMVRDFSSPKVAELVERLYFVSSHILVVPELMDLDVLNADVYHLMYENLYVFDIDKGLANPLNKALKRLMDIVLSSIGIILFSPVLLFEAVLVLIKDGFPIFYNHERYGKGGRIFTFHKFRSMWHEKYPDENYDRVKEYVKNDPKKKEVWEKFQKLENDPNDPRIMPGMNLIRKTSIDELAQLFNVLKGDMSIVGPRPFMTRERELMGDYFDRVLAAKPGVTDLWTVSGRDSLTFNQRLKMSTWYIQNWSLWLDIIIITKTVQQVILYFFKWSNKSRKISTNT